MACNAAPDFDEELNTVRSWTATVELADSELHAGATTQAFTTRLLAAAADALEQSRHSLQQVAQSNQQRAHARAAMESLATALERVRRDTAGR